VNSTRPCAITGRRAESAPTLTVQLAQSLTIDWTGTPVMRNAASLGEVKVILVTRNAVRRNGRDQLLERCLIVEDA